MAARGGREQGGAGIGDAGRFGSIGVDDLPTGWYGKAIPTPEVVMTGIVPNLWFDTEGLEAAEFYASIFPNSAITNVSRYGDEGMGEPGSVLAVDFVLDGQRFTGINGGPQFRFNEAVSFAIPCADEAEVDHYWDSLVEGGEEGRCGWLKDRYGVSWQVIPAVLGELLSDPDPERASRAMQAMLAMNKLDGSALRAAADGVA